MSIRNMDADVASNKLNELFHLHRYEDCVLFINRLSHLTIKLVLSQISIDMYLSRLPYTIEILEALYAKVFIMDPDNFPVRALQPERVIDKMVAYFSLLSDQTRMEPIDGAKMLDSFENVIRIISYVQPNLYSRLLYFKYAIDKGLLRLEKDLALYSNSIQLAVNNNPNLTCLSQMNEKAMSTSLILNSSSSTSNTGTSYHLNVGSLKKASSKSKTALTNAILISRISNMQSCEQLRNELTVTIQNCDKSLSKLNEFINQLKSQKQFKEIQFYLNQTQTQQLKQQQQCQQRKENENENEINETHDTEEETVLLKPKNKLNKSRKQRSESVKSSRREKSIDESNADELIAYPSAVVCQDVIQNRLYLNKAMMNSVEPYLQTVKLQQLLNSLYEKIDLDKEILLVFTHLKREERHLSSVEPLQPLFRRYSLGFERVIQIWRRKCSADSLLLFNDRLNSNPTDSLKRNQPKQFTHQLDKLYIVDNDESDQMDQMHASYSSSALAMHNANGLTCSNSKSREIASSAAAAAVAVASSAAASLSCSNQYANLADCYLANPNDSNLDDLSRIQSAIANASKNQKFFSEVNLYATPTPSIYNTMPTKLKAQKMSTNLTVSSFRDSFMLSEESGGIYKQKSNFSPDHAQMSQGQMNQSNGVVHSDTFDSLSNLTDTKMKADNLVLTEKEQEIERLNKELSNAKDTIAKLRKNENKLREKLQEKESNEMYFDYSIETSLNNNKNEYTSDLIQMYVGLNAIHRVKAYDSLDSVKEIQSMNEFKLKLLFSVVILAYRYVKLYIRDLKRRVKSILQISEQRASVSNVNKTSVKSNSATPTIIVQKPDNETIDSNVDKSTKNAVLKSSDIIDNALNKYLQVVTTSKTFDLNKIVEDVKEQLWTTLYDYPLKECHELNNFINESVKTSWSLINHEPSFKLDYASIKFDTKLHERTESSNRQSEHIIQYVWPSLMDTTDNFCLSKALVIT